MAARNPKLKMAKIVDPGEKKKIKVSLPSWVNPITNKTTELFNGVPVYGRATLPPKGFDTIGQDITLDNVYFDMASPPTEEDTIAHIFKKDLLPEKIEKLHPDKSPPLLAPLEILPDAARFIKTMLYLLGFCFKHLPRKVVSRTVF